MDLPALTHQQTIDLWFKYEQVAMHFNELLIQFRLQLLGGAGALGAIAAGLISSRVSDAPQRHWLRAIVSSGILVLLAAGAVLDIFYYQPLLRGAVEAILDLERNQLDGIRLSTMIEEEVGYGKHAPAFAYIFVLLSMTLFTGWAWIQHHRREKPRAIRRSG